MPGHTMTLFEINIDTALSVVFARHTNTPAIDDQPFQFNALFFQGNCHALGTLAGDL